MMQTPRIARFLAVVALAAPAVGADWPTYRRSAQRTGSDGQPGPRSPKVLWVHEASEHFIASPVATDQALYVSALGTFNTAAFYSLSIDPAAAQRVQWKKGPPALRQAMVCAPAIAGDKLIFGDGMHQTDGATLRCLSSSGRPIWQLPVGGALVHLEGAPTIANGRVYIGGGSAGILCVDMNAVTLDGKEMDLAAAQQVIEKKWGELQAAYEQEKQKDPDFAIPPSDDSLPKPAPKLIWQVGQDKMHVDSALAVVGDNVLASSAGLDVEKVGDRALYCLDAATGQTRWRTPLPHNPWAGPSVAGELVILGCSSIRFDPKELTGAKGEVLACNLKDGQIRWRKDVSGGIIAPIAIADNLAICAGTDGKVRGLSITDGQQKWEYDAGAGFFGGAAVSTGVVYVADLKSVVHAIQLKDGSRLWRLDLAADAGVHANGMVYGSPVLHKGRLYLGTCSLESGQQRNVVVCIGS